MKLKKIPRREFSRNALELAPFLLGKYLVREGQEGRIVLKITEVESYMGRGDAACHARDGRMTERTRVMFEEGGVFYVYLIYGMYHCLNVVSGPKGEGEAVLVRCARIVEGHDRVAENRYGKKYGELSSVQRRNLLDGPGKLCRAMRIDRSLNGSACDADDFYLAYGEDTDPSRIRTAPRVNIDYAGPASLFPWRFILEP